MVSVLERRHEVELYRRSGTPVRDSRGRLTQPWQRIAGPVSADFQASSGRVVPGPAGQEIRLAGVLFVHPSALPASVEARPGDAVVITGGRAGRRVFLVHALSAEGERAGRWDDELVLAETDEPVEVTAP